MNNTSQNKPRITAEEYFSISPETNCSTELIGGEIVALASPSVQHQEIAGGLFAELRQFIRKNGGSCKPFIAPMDVRLDQWNVVQPDVFVTCKPDSLTEYYLDGAPDLVIEVVSTNHSDDFDRKLLLYRTSGVREYWIADPKNRKTLVYFFEQTDFPDIYTFETPIPVGIYGGAFSIRIADLLS